MDEAPIGQDEASSRTISSQSRKMMLAEMAGGVFTLRNTGARSRLYGLGNIV